MNENIPTISSFLNSIDEDNLNNADDTFKSLVKSLVDFFEN
jgi:hypothetical protein